MLRWLSNGMARVSAFTVHEPPKAGGTRLDRAERLLFVGDGFSWLVVLFGPLYFLARGEWLALAAYTAAAVVLASILSLAGVGSGWSGWIFFLLNVVAGFEANELKRWSLGRAGWQEIAVVSGRGREEAERRFFEAWLPSVETETAGTIRAMGGSFAAIDEGSATSRVEGAVRRLSERLRSKFAIKT
ncbi:DUF2628 domain-containing protein [Hyphomicrobium sp.]|uniref:DUF2628 domain-containing protein n=1 Tax=Hyphomicrobium sp. TaxID=82 RepID=UPI0025BF6179|nr:DUF2628 domain-containing protein [Hyphomicrobium sp.]MCC7252810.1 DUF2628 domain-containing protein [Hyphomicrobium sp.]